MVQTYSDIAARPQVPGYPLVNQHTSDDARHAADFERILREHGSQAAAPAKPAAAASSSSGGGFMSFLKGLVDVINPLQHIPVISSLYRHMTGDEIGPTARFIGDALYGGPIGGAIAAADIAYQHANGKDVGETVIASLTGGSKASDTAIAENFNDTVAPAAGGTATSPRPPAGDFHQLHNNIVWADPPAQTPEPPLFPPSLSQGTNGEGPASPLMTAQPALHKKSVASTNTLQSQEAPAEAARSAASPELIASKMREGLEKYAEMKRGGLASTVSTLH